MYHAEVTRYWKALPLLKLAILLACTSIVLGVINNRGELLLFVSDAASDQRAMSWSKSAEEILKVFAEGVLIGSCAASFEIAKRLPHTMGSEVTAGLGMGKVLSD